MGLAVFTTSVLHVKIFVHRVIYAVIHAATQFKGANDLVALTIHQFNAIGISSICDDEAVRLCQISHRERLAETFDTMNSLSRPQVEHLDCLLIFGSKE